MKKTLILIVAMIVIAGLSSAASIVLSTNNQTTWQNSVGAWSSFPFTGNTGLCLSCVSPSSPAGTNITATVSGNNNYSGIFSNVFQDVLTTGQIPNAADPTLLALST